MKKATGRTYWSSALLQTAEAAIRAIVNIAITFEVAKYLGPADFGVLMLALGLVAIGSVIARFGLNELAIKKFSLAEGVGRSFCAILLVRSASSLGAILSTFMFTLILYGAETPITSATLVLLAAILFQPLEVFELRRQAVGEYTSIIIFRFFQTVLVALLKIIAINQGWSLYAMLAIFCFELIFFYALLATYEIIFERINLNIKCSAENLKGLVHEAMPIWVFNIIGILCVKVDQIILSVMITPEDLGLYTAAVRLTEVWYLLPTIASTAITGWFVTSYQSDKLQYIKKLYSTLSVVMVLATAVTVILVAFSNWLVVSAFGRTYEASASILEIYAAGGILMWLARFMNKHIIILGRTDILVSKAVSLLFLNVILNLLIIPTYGATGAAFATVLSLFFSEFVLYLYYRKPLFFVGASE